MQRQMTGAFRRLLLGALLASACGFAPDLAAQTVERQRPGATPPSEIEERKPLSSAIQRRVAPPTRKDPSNIAPIPDRWRLIEAVGVEESILDPYNRNPIKGDRPLFGTKDWFINILAISDTVAEPRSVPTPVGIQSSDDAGDYDLFGDADQFIFNQNFIFSASLIKGDTAYKPPDLEFRLTPVINYNYADVQERRVLYADPRQGTERTDTHFALQEAFVDYHIRNVSDRYDFDSVRVGIQPFSTDFRGFLFQDNQLGVRFFGDRDNNIYQYNLAWFRRLEKDTNSGLNDVDRKLREDDVFIANLYWQDFPSLGFQSQVTGVYNRNREGDDFFFDNNNFIQRPSSFGAERGRNYDIGYLGYNGDGHFGRLNLTTSFYYAFGNDRNSTFTNEDVDVSAFFAAAEPSVDFDWVRLRGSLVYASGDDDPFDGTHTGFDAIFENPQIAGSDTNYWIRQAIPLIGGGGVVLSNRNAMLPSLRGSKEHGQSNFANPGFRLIGAGADFDILPELRLSTNLNYMQFDETAVLEVARNQQDISRDIGWDLSAALIYRPFFSQNIVFRLSGAALFAGQGIKDLYGEQNGDDDMYYTVLANLILTY
ncbi:hypothetical protein NUH88_14615 [Nisaea acidiphila]|uniref:Alginate export domain-containing protein n=1 Tax=Nisaea acidiphila TaxID=1862145 RepID=A0A9J7AN98_9PROT|nr:hypothetical protein [Nisaea acidiphila]UUX48638.1 hypothetical protein NUH88_14615 [Nisaea acidiphila]